MSVIMHKEVIIILYKKILSKLPRVFLLKKYWREMSAFPVNLIWFPFFVYKEKWTILNKLSIHTSVSLELINATLMLNNKFHKKFNKTDLKMSVNTSKKAKTF